MRLVRSCYTAASSSLSVTSSVNGDGVAIDRAAFSVVITTSSSLQVRVQLGKRAIVAVLVLVVCGVVYSHRIVLGFQPHRCGLKESKVCVRNHVMSVRGRGVKVRVGKVRVSVGASAMSAE